MNYERVGISRVEVHKRAGKSVKGYPFFRLQVYEL